MLWRKFNFYPLIFLNSRTTNEKQKEKFHIEHVDFLVNHFYTSIRFQRTHNFQTIPFDWNWNKKRNHSLCKINFYDCVYVSKVHPFDFFDCKIWWSDRLVSVFSVKYFIHSSWLLLVSFMWPRRMNKTITLIIFIIYNFKAVLLWTITGSMLLLTTRITFIHRIEFDLVMIECIFIHLSYKFCRDGMGKIIR